MNAYSKVLEAANSFPADTPAGAMGRVAAMIARESEGAAEIIAGDIANPDMSFDKCFDALAGHAKAHAQNGRWSCACVEFDIGNPIIGVVLDFYKIPRELFAPGAASPGPADLLDLL